MVVHQPTKVATITRWSSGTDEELPCKIETISIVRIHHEINQSIHEGAYSLVPPNINGVKTHSA